MTLEATHAPPIIPDYELLRLVGRGSYGDVWLARGITGLYRAVKIVWRARFDDRLPYEREFKGLREFAAVSLVEARQLALLHVGRNDAAGFFYYIMELADDAAGRSEIDPDTYVPHTLKVVRERRGRVPAPQVIALGADLARALAGLHARGLVHRDVKPSNVIFVGGVPKLADIGLVAVATSAQTFVGTEGFVPPEGPGTPTADVFSLGKLLYEISTGLDRHDYPRLPPNLGDLPDRKQLMELNEILIRACDSVPARRYADASVLLEDLLLLQAGRSMRRLRAAERSLGRAIRIGTALGLVAAIAGAGVYMERRRAQQETTLRRMAEAERDDLARKTVYSAGLARVQRAIDLGNLGQARNQLNELAPKNGEPDLRGLEWDLLKTDAQGDPAEVLQESGASVEKVRFSPKGNLLAWQSSDMRVTLWDISTHKPVRTIEGMFSLVDFSPDGQWLLGTDAKSAFQRWSVDTGQFDILPVASINYPVAALIGERGVCFTISQDGIAPHLLRIWNFSRHAEVMSLPIPTNADNAHWDFYRGVVSANERVGALALIAGRGSEAHWQLQTFDLVGRKKTWSEPSPHMPMSLALSPDGSQLVVGYGNTAEVQLCDLASGTWRWRRNLSQGEPHSISFSPDGKRLAIGGRDSVVYVLDAATGESLNTLHGHEGSVFNVVWSPDNHTLLSGSSSGNVRLWPEALPSKQSLIDSEWDPSSRSAQGSVFVSNDGRHLAFSKDDDHVRVLDARTLGVLADIPDASRPVGLFDDNRVLLATTPKGHLKMWRWDLPTPTFEEFVPFTDGFASKAVLSADGHWLATSDTSGRIQVWDWSTKQRLFEAQAHRVLAWGLAFSPDGESLVTVGDDKKIKIWETRTGKLLRTLRTTDITLTLVFSPHADVFAVGLQGTVELYSLKTGSLQRVLHTSIARISGLSFSGDGSRLICGGANGLTQIYATDDWREVTTLIVGSASGAGNNTVNHIAVSADSRIMAIYLNDGRIRVWRR